jgi:hypothetical protein
MTILMPASISVLSLLSLPTAPPGIDILQLERMPEDDRFAVRALDHRREAAVRRTRG